ncbi:MAG: tetratricopeptide repeat protein [Clostridia bacterium]|nr:tetratricopeptide repeat protein [Clostridia bacterium]
MKITEIEEQLELNGFSEDLFSEFKAALRRVPKSSRCQHCYTTACELQANDFLGAIKMIEYGLSDCDTDYIDLMRSYLNLGIIYESNEKYIEAKEAYKNALKATQDKSGYLSSLSMNILRMELHINDFSYTEELSALYNDVCEADTFEKEMRYFIFYGSIAKMIISEHNGDMTSYLCAYNSAVSALDGSAVNAIDKILNKHKFKNEAKATDASIEYLRKAKSKL